MPNKIKRNETLCRFKFKIWHVERLAELLTYLFDNDCITWFSNCVRIWSREGNIEIWKCVWHSECGGMFYRLGRCV